VRYGLSAGHSLVIEDDVAETLYQELVRNHLITHPGGTIGNTMHNYSVLADDRSVLLGSCAATKSAATPIAICATPPD
jgi:inosine kinase